jgi:hypothetical protein
MMAMGPDAIGWDDSTVTVISTLTVSRATGSWTDKLRPYEIVVDDVPRGRVAAGATLSLALSPGRHHVRAGRGPGIDVHLGPGAVVGLRLETAGGVRLVPAG